MPLTDEQRAQGWIEHTGGECPVADRWSQVTVMLRRGATERHPDCRWLEWESTPPDDIRHGSDIIAYLPEPKQ